ncbi:MAG: glutamate ABC transporter substrate-binding protein [Catenulispora sp.]|nr:glutamate ABC transporter substrate-binding protein [Catenulispora sp.]
MRSKHIAAFALTAAFGATALSGCGSAKKADGSGAKGPAPSVTVATSASFPAGSTMEKLNKAGKITIGIKIDQPGIGLKDPAGGKYTGFDVEIGKIIAADLGLKPEQINWVEAVSANRETFLQNGTVDIVIASYSITDTRKQKVSFAGPYLETDQDLLVAKDSKIAGLADLDGKKVCSAKGSTSFKNIQTNIPKATAVGLDTYSQCVDQLGTGQVDAVTTDGAILQGYAAKSAGQLKYLPVSVNPDKQKYGIGLTKDDTAFRSWLDDQLTKSYGDGTWAAAYNATLGQAGTAAPTPPAVDKY